MLMPPSLGGTVRCVRTSSPALLTSSSTTSVNRTFWNTPPLSATVSQAEAFAWSTATRAAARPIDSWNPAATTSTAVPWRRSPINAATSGAGSMTASPASSRSMVTS